MKTIERSGFRAVNANDENVWVGNGLTGRTEAEIRQSILRKLSARLDQENPFRHLK